LAEHSEVQGNVSLVAISILEKLAPSIDSDTRESFVTDQVSYMVTASVCSRTAEPPPIPPCSTSFIFCALEKALRTSA
jgi:hypothetical protein